MTTIQQSNEPQESPEDEPSPAHRPELPRRVLGIALVSLLVPVLGTLLLPQQLSGLASVLWLTLLVPAFPLAFYRGWKGVGASVAVGTLVFGCTVAATTVLGRPLPDLTGWVYAAYLAIAAGVGRTSQLLHRQNADVQGQALTDNLTGLPNRRHARSFLEREFSAAKRGNLLSVVLFDLDGFKAFNDLHGHRAGDRALARFGEILTATTRRMNLSSRFGGEEFLSVLSGSSEEGAVVFAERVREALESVRLPQGSLTVSAGVASYHPSIPSTDELIAAADLALYRAKREGRNCVRVFGTPEPPSEGQEDRRRDPQQTTSAQPTEGGVMTGSIRSEGQDPAVLIEAARAMVRAVERRAVHKSGRSGRVAGFAEILARATSVSIDLEALRIACEFHDVGDVAVPSDVLTKKGQLTREELLQVQQHPVVGHRILQALVPNGEVLAAAKWHHERWDGSGYPEGLIGDAIPLAARVVAIADALDAMTSARPYRAALPWQVAVEQISSLGGSQFDPALIERFRAVLPELERLASASVPPPPTEGD